ncbi:hypothetical protein [Alloalcanivorax gelatiniphagus]|uniref:Uncharacterized protein n=1 Tax=Alloalcanivorax gelatiniphagus TaxID=1194167 RepID=A0ABY2XJ09_9GAMM|nr:hypothetical protein [Alloalcanivorax gelatiniphagus]TMW11026.1 hypothetical protein FGS76_17145 [Alloalcanivorax gelatiniphagus]
MVFDERAVLNIQVVASLMMAAEYFFPKAARQVIDTYLVGYFGDIDDNVSKDWRKFLTYLGGARWKILLSASFLVFLAFFYDPLFYYIERAGGVALLGSLIIFGLGFLKSASIICNVLASATVLFGFGGLLRAVSIFLIRTEKGPFAGAGFVLLLISFSMQYARIDAL